jgi:hypothetical protein
MSREEETAALKVIFANVEAHDRLKRAARRLATLAHNIAIGAALCEADRLGYRRCSQNWDECEPDWAPGCQRPAPTGAK